jgi:hypothetical protein
MFHLVIKPDATIFAKTEPAVSALGELARLPARPFSLDYQAVCVVPGFWVKR